MSFLRYVGNLKYKILKDLSSSGSTIFFVIQQINMGQTDGRGKKLMQKKLGKRHKRLKGVKEIEDN